MAVLVAAVAIVTVTGALALILAIVPDPHDLQLQGHSPTERDHLHPNRGHTGAIASCEHRAARLMREQH